MIKKISKFLALCGMIFVLGAAPNVMAGGSNKTPLEFSASATSATANSSNTITFSVFVFRYVCPDGNIFVWPNCPDGSMSTQKQGEPNHQVGIFTSATGLIYGGTQSWPNGVHYVTTGSDGKASFTVASSSEGVKSLKISLAENGEANSDDAVAKTLSVTFNAPQNTSTTPKKTTTTPAPAPQPVEPTPPATPQATTFTVGNEVVADTTKLTFKEDEPFTLKGTTVPNGVVKLFIFSTPREATVTADAQGNWSYVVQDIEAGDHHVEVEVTDPTTQKTSARNTIATFTVTAAQAAITTVPAVAPQDQTWLWYTIGGMLIVAGLGGAAALWRYHNKRKATIIGSPESSRPNPQATTKIDPPTPPLT